MSEFDPDALPDPPYVIVAEFTDRGSADAIAALLRSEEIRVAVDPSGVLAGLAATYQVLVSESVAHRARWILQETEFSDAELTFLATGKLGSDNDP